MKTKIGLILVCVMGLAVFLGIAWAQSVPQLISYQGRLTEPSGLPPADGSTVDITFSFYGVEGGATPLYLTVLQEDVTVTGGLYEVLIGSGTITPGPAPDGCSTIREVFRKHSDVWLGIKVDSDPEMTPRSKITSVPYALSLEKEFLVEFMIGQASNSDYDGDGHLKAPFGEPNPDCNDWRNDVYPGAAEVCDGIDNQCPGDAGYGYIDEGCPGVCTDKDADSYFYEAGCGTPVDCDDSNPDTWAGALEVCDGEDNQCPGNGQIDETFPELGDQCIDGLGICARYGEYVCTLDKLGTECNATAGPPDFLEYCNYLDDDCDGTVDNDWVDGEGDYSTSVDHCGACTIICALIFPGVGPPDSYLSCEDVGGGQCAVNCEPSYYDLNGFTGDGCEFYLDPNIIYVSSTNGVDDAGCGLGPVGTGDYPCASISTGISRAVALARTSVNVADGIYQESVTLSNGISLRGGFREDTWERHLYTTNTVIQGNTPAGHRKTIVAQNINSPTTFEGFVIYGQNNNEAGGNSYAIWIKDSGSDLIVSSNVIFAADGGGEQDGTGGSDGIQGVNGQNGIDAYQPSGNFDCYEECVGSESAGGARGYRTCFGSNVSGGDGGRANCPDWDEGQNNCTFCPDGENQTQTNNGQTGLNGGGSGGTGGFDFFLDFFCNSDCACYNPSSGPGNASDGGDGSNGSNGSGGNGCSSGGGTVTANEWVGISGVTGSDASDGRGGGGGGAGGGVETYYNVSCLSSGYSDLGGSGGGGGSGGCRGWGGGGAGSGGGSFAIFVRFNSLPGADVPVISDNTIYRGNGGDGGEGGSGGTGGLGSSGGSGGNGGIPGSSYWCAGEGGDGGDGGHGGHGGGGGGGCGGVSYGIYASGQGSADLSAWMTGNTFIPGGAGGLEGSGGSSLGNSGASGSPGLSGNTNF